MCWDGLRTLSFGLSQFNGHGYWLLCEEQSWSHGKTKTGLIECMFIEHPRSRPRVSDVERHLLKLNMCMQGMPRELHHNFTLVASPVCIVGTSGSSTKRLVTTYYVASAYKVLGV